MLFPLSLLSFRKNRYNKAYLEFRKGTVNISHIKGFLVTPILYRDRFKNRQAGVVELVDTRDLKSIYIDYFFKLKLTKSIISKHFLDYPDLKNNL